MVQKISLAQTQSFQQNFIDYISEKDSLKPFYGEFPTIEGFKNQIDNKSFGYRKVLVDSLKKQYKMLGVPANIELLNNENTFTVTTGHQLNIFTGPLYVILKIVSTINLAKKLKETYPNYNFVPVYWMASEDHDFEEIASFNLFGQTHTWETAQTGSVGRMNPVEVLKIIEGLREKPEVFETAYKNNDTLASAVREYMHALFGADGLVTIDSDERDLKALFTNVIKDDIFNNTSEKVVSETSNKIEATGFKTQINARNINFFYLDNGIRERIEKEGEVYKVLNTDLAFSKAEIEQLIENEPEKFSPNVVLRGLYQETILPNLAYIGGPSELVYWLQLKDMFEHYSVRFPILCPRNFAMIINGGIQKKFEKVGITYAEIFQDEVSLRKKYVEENSQNSLDISSETEEINAVFAKILEKAVTIDQSLQGYIEAERAKQNNALDNIEKRLKKSEERNFETSINQLLSLKEKLFPGGTLQERKENFLNFYFNDPEFINKLKTDLDPLDFNFNIIVG